MTLMKEKVSIIIPVYNSENYIEKCIDSIINQTYTNIEVIVIDDGSTDNSYKIINELVHKYPEIVKGYTQENQGVANTRNNGIKYSSGKYVMFVDNDDYLDSDCVEVFVNAIERENADIIIGGYRRVSIDGKVLMERKLSRDPFCKYVQICPWGKIYRKSLIQENNIEFLSYPIGEDVYMNYIAYYYSKKTVTIEYVGYNWLYNEKSISSTIHRKIGGESNPIKMMDKIIERIGNDREYDEGMYEYAFIKFIVWYLLYSCKGAKKEVIYKEYDSLFNWIEKNFSKYHKNAHLGLCKPKGELLSVRLSVYIFVKLHKIRIGKLFLNIYSKI